MGVAISFKLLNLIWGIGWCSVLLSLSLATTILVPSDKARRGKNTRDKENSSEDETMVKAKKEDEKVKLEEVKSEVNEDEEDEEDKENGKGSLTITTNELLKQKQL